MQSVKSDLKHRLNYTLWNDADCEETHTREHTHAYAHTPAASLLGVYYGSPLVPAQAASTLLGVYYGSPLVPAKAPATLPGVQTH